MTKEYQEALSSMQLFEARYKTIEPQESYDPLAVAYADLLSALSTQDRKTILEALQAGAKAEELGVTLDDLISAHAEGRLLPKLPTKYRFSSSAIGIGLIGELEFEYYFGETPAEAMQNAIDKIGGAV